eukprot:6178471-Pleurochrysis_carterae.AAC.1
MWMSPEMIEAGQYDARTDIWSLGITAIELAQMKPPLSDVQPPVRVLFLIPSNPPPTLDKPEFWSAEFREFLGACLTKDPAGRPDAPGALRHAFISAVANNGAAELLGLVDAYHAADANASVRSPSSSDSTLASTWRCQGVSAPAFGACAGLPSDNSPTSNATANGCAKASVYPASAYANADPNATLLLHAHALRPNVDLDVDQADATLLRPADALHTDDFAFMCDYDVDSPRPSSTSQQWGGRGDTLIPPKSFPVPVSDVPPTSSSSNQPPSPKSSLSSKPSSKPASKPSSTASSLPGSSRTDAHAAMHETLRGLAVGESTAHGTAGGVESRLPPSPQGTMQWDGAQARTGHEARTHVHAKGTRTRPHARAHAHALSHASARECATWKRWQRQRR